MLLTTSLTTIEPLYTLGLVVIPLRRIGVSLKSPCASLVVTVIVVVGIAPSPALMEVIPIGSARRSPTILYSSTRGSKSLPTG